MDLLSFQSLQQEEAESFADQVLGLEVLAIPDIRVGFAAARIAFQRNPASFAKEQQDAVSPQQHLLDHLVTYTCKNDLRSREDADEDQARINRVRRNAASLSRRFLKGQGK